MQGEVTLSEMKDYLNKLTRLIGPRSLTGAEGQKNLRSVAAMVDGTMAPMNMGYDVHQKQDPAEGLLWRTLWVEAGEKKSKDVVLIVVPYAGTGENVAFALGLAEYLTKDQPQKKVKLVFSPPLLEVKLSWLQERVLDESENLLGSVLIQTELGVETGAGAWASVDFPGNKTLQESVLSALKQRNWLERLNVSTLSATTAGDYDFSVTLHPDIRGGLAETAEIFLRMLPVVKVILDVVSES